jgi:hypothetical protein
MGSLVDQCADATRAAKRWAKAARDMPTLAASEATVHRWAGSSCRRRSASLVAGSVSTRYQAGGVASGLVHRARKRDHEDQIQEPGEERVRHRLR